MTPLVEGDRLQALRLARRRAAAARRRRRDPAPRIELCAATFLQNREADDGGARDRQALGRARRLRVRGGAFIGTART